MNLSDFQMLVDKMKHQPLSLKRLSRSLDKLISGPERTLTIIKPDAVQKGLIGEVIKRLEIRGVKPVGMKMIKLHRFQAEIFYRHLRGKLRPGIFDSVLKYMTSKRVVLIVWQGRGVVGKVRELCGPTDPSKARRGQIRSLSRDSLADRLNKGTAVKNIIHASASKSDARQEISLFFFPWEIVSK